MNIGIIGNGGREHAFAKNFRSKSIKNFCLPGNAGTSLLATNLQVNILILKSTSFN